jgi:hypothetical protein
MRDNSQQQDEQKGESSYGHSSHGSIPLMNHIERYSYVLYFQSVGPIFSRQDVGPQRIISEYADGSYRMTISGTNPAGTSVRPERLNITELFPQSFMGLLE